VVTGEQPLTETTPWTSLPCKLYAEADINLICIHSALRVDLSAAALGLLMKHGRTINSQRLRDSVVKELGLSLSLFFFSVILLFLCTLGVQKSDSPDG
jgi:hypothetical protein